MRRLKYVLAIRIDRKQGAAKRGGDIPGSQDEVLATANGRRVAVIMVNYAPARLEGHFAAAPAALCAT